ncbi:MAG: ABC transporter ATP-binding protein, partial [Chloroflexi bacterium]|nr:ABC transporter ATP-binding protein [Chloroflexota bacterium]
LHTHFFTKEGIVKAVNGVSFVLRRGETLGLVGESGAGKTVTAWSILRILPYPGRVVAGVVRFRGENLLAAGEERMRALRGKEMAIVFQDPVAALNPVIPVGEQVAEVFLTHTSMSKRQARDEAVGILAEMGLPDPEAILSQYIFQISGGMAQRVMLAMALALRPSLLIADEPTSNLDVTLQAEILQRLRHMAQELGTAILLITHNLGLVAQMADRVAVMYAGTVVEQVESQLFYERPLHPYSWGLFQSLPRLDRAGRPLTPIRGTPPDLMALSEQCPFVPRCPKALSICRTEPRPVLMELEPRHWAACYNPIQHTDGQRSEELGA